MQGGTQPAQGAIPTTPVGSTGTSGSWTPNADIPPAGAPQGGGAQGGFPVNGVPRQTMQDYVQNFGAQPQGSAPQQGGAPQTPQTPQTPQAPTPALAPGFTIGEAGEPGDKPFRRAVPEGTDPADEQAAALMFPSVGQNQKRLQFLTAQAQQRAELENKTDVAKQQGVNQTNAINLRNTGQNYRAGLSNDTKRDIATMNAGQRDRASQLSNFRANLNEIILNNPNIDPNEAVKRAAIGMNGARSNFQPNQPQAPQQGGRQPTQDKPQAPVSIPPAALSRLKEGTNTRFSNGQTWTLQNGQPVQVQ